LHAKNAVKEGRWRALDRQMRKHNHRIQGRRSVIIERSTRYASLQNARNHGQFRVDNHL
jgi:hypothetical protein